VALCSSSADVFLWGSSLPCIDVGLWEFDGVFLPVSVSCIREKCSAMHVMGGCETVTTVPNVLPNKQTNSVALVRKRTIPTERPPLVDEVSTNFCG
jgi:hypothetical protein